MFMMFESERALIRLRKTAILSALGSISIHKEIEILKSHNVLNLNFRFKFPITREKRGNSFNDCMH